jgi:sugar lactone lactonase YvrE
VLRADNEGFWGIGTFWGGIIIFCAIFIILFSSLFTNFAGIREGLVGSISYWIEQHGVQRGNQPWYYYLLILSVYETLPFVFAIVGTVRYLRRPTWLTTFLIWWWVLSLVIYSWAGERMPWLTIHITLPMVLLSAYYLGGLASSALGWRAGRPAGVDGRTPLPPEPRSVWEQWLAFGGLGVLALWTIHTGWPVNFERPDTPRDLLVYTQTAPDVKKVMADIERLSLEQTGDSKGLGIVVQSGTWWPFSWYLRDFKNAEYPAQLTAQATKPVVLVAAEDDDKNRQYLQGYSRTRYKMRWWYPEDYRSIPDEMAKSGGWIQYLARKDVRDGLWKWLIYRETTQPLGSYDFYVYIKDGLTPNGSAGAPAADATSPQPGLPGQAVGQNGQVGAPAGQSGQPAPPGDPPQYAEKLTALAPVAAFGTAGKGPGQLTLPRGLALDAQGNVYVADSLNHRIQKLDPTGKPLAAWGTQGNGDGQFQEPNGVAVDAQGNVYVADTWNHRIQKFDPTGKFLTKWSGQNGPFWGPRGITTDAQGNVYVTDTGNKRIQKFDPTGKFLAQFGTAGSGPGQLNEPIGLAVGADGSIYVADTNNRRVQKLGPDGQPVAAWPISGWTASVGNEPSLALDGQGNVYVTDPSGGRIIKLSPTGDVLAVAGSPGRQPGQLTNPVGITVNPTGDIIFVSDAGNNRIQEVTVG